METKGLRKKLFPTRRKRRGTKKESADAVFIPKENTTHYRTPNNFLLSYIFSQSSSRPCLLPPLPPSLSCPTSLRLPSRPSQEYIISSKWSNIRTRDREGKEEKEGGRQKRGKRRELGGLNKETAIIISNIILRLGVS